MKAVGDLLRGEHGWMAAEEVYLAPDGRLHLHGRSRVLDDRERNDAWLKSGGARDVADTLVERTRGGDIVVDAAFYRRFSRVGGALPDGALPDGALPDGALPAVLRDPSGATNPLPCGGCGAPTPRSRLVPARDGSGYCETCHTVIPGKEEEA